LFFAALAMMHAVAGHYDRAGSCSTPAIQQSLSNPKTLAVQEITPSRDLPLQCKFNLKQLALPSCTSCTAMGEG
jgi:hypothetical protein